MFVKKQLGNIFDVLFCVDDWHRIDINVSGSEKKSRRNVEGKSCLEHKWQYPKAPTGEQETLERSSGFRDCKCHKLLKL